MTEADVVFYFETTDMPASQARYLMPCGQLCEQS